MSSKTQKSSLEAEEILPQNTEIAGQNPMQERINALEKKADGYFKLMKANDQEFLTLLEQIKKIKAEPEKASADKIEFLEGNLFKILSEGKLDFLTGDRYLSEKVEAAEKLANMLKKNPQLDVETVRPEDVIRDEDLLEQAKKNPEIWKLIKQNAKDGLTIDSLFKKDDFQLNNPDTWIGAAGHHGYKLAAKVSEFTKKNPELVTVAALGAAGLAIYLLWKGESQGTKAVGVAAGATAVALGYSLWGNDLAKEMVENGLKKMGVSQEKIDQGKKIIADTKDQTKKTVEKGKKILGIGEVKRDPETGLEIKRISNNPVYQYCYEKLYEYKTGNFLGKLGSWGPTLTKNEANELIKKLETLKPDESLSGWEWFQLANSMIAMGLAHVVFDGVAGMLTIGGTWTFKVEKSFVDLVYKSMSGDKAGATLEYAKGYLMVFGVATIREIANAMKESFKANPHEALQLGTIAGRGILRAGVKSFFWPVTSIQYAGQMASTGARMLKVPLGEIRYVNNVLEFIDHAGVKVANFAVKPENIFRRAIGMEEREFNYQSAKEAWETPRRVALGKDTFLYKGDTFTLTEAESGKGDMTKIKAALEQKWNTPNDFKTTTEGKWFRYQGRSFFLSNAELSFGQNANDVTKLCEQKILDGLKIEGMVKTGNGGFKIKIGGQWIESANINDPIALEKAKADYRQLLKKNGMALPEYLSLQNSKFLRFLPILQSVVSPLIAINIIHDLEKASNKKKALAHTMAGLGTFMAGMNITQFLAKSYAPKSPAGLAFKFILTLGGAMAAQWGFSDDIERLMRENLPTFETEYGGLNNLVYGSVVDVVTSVTTATTMRGLGKRLAKMEFAHLLKKHGVAYLARRMEGKVMKTLTKFTGKGVLRAILARIAPRLATGAGLLADDSTVFGIINDPLLVPLAAWTIYDMAGTINVVRNAYNIQSTIKGFANREIASFKFADQRSENAFLRICQLEGIPDPSAVNKEQIQEIIAKCPDIELEIQYQGSGSVKMHLLSGEMAAVAVIDPSGKHYELTREDLTTEVKVLPPMDLENLDPDYKNKEMPLQEQYRGVLLPLVVNAGWTRTNYEIIDDDTVKISRVEDGRALNLIRLRDNSWSIEGVGGKYKLLQAAALANLINKVATIIKKEEHRAGSENPFEVDGENLDFDRGGLNPVDLRILAGENKWLNFYKDIGVKPETLTEVLNKWYHNKDAIPFSPKTKVKKPSEGEIENQQNLAA